MSHLIYTKKDFSRKPAHIRKGFFVFIKDVFYKVYIFVLRKRSQRHVQKMLKHNFVEPKKIKKAKNIRFANVSEYPVLKTPLAWRTVAAVFAVLFLGLTIITSQYYAPQFIEAEIKVQNFTKPETIVTDGIELLKYETLSTDTINSKAEFDAKTYSSGNFETLEDDVVAYADADDYLELGHYGDNPPDTSDNDWWDDNSFQTCSNTAFAKGTHSDTQYDNTNDWLELDSTGLTNGSGTYTSEIFDAGDDISWNTLTWNTTHPTLKDLPDNKQTEFGYSEGNVDMEKNEFLMHFEESSGSVADSSGNGFSGTPGSTTTYGATGRFNKALDFSGGSSGELTIDDSAHPLGYTDKVSYGAWFKADSFRNWAGIISRMSAWPNGYNLQVGTVQKIACGSGVYTNSDSMPVAGQWYHAVCVYDGTQMKLYVNGVLQTDVDTHTLTESTTDKISIGEFYTRGSTLDFDGQIDEAFISHEELSATDVLEMYERGAHRTKFQVRSCDDNACSGETFAGPDGTNSTYYTEEMNDGLTLPSVDLSHVSDNRYFQYRTTLETDISTTSPEVQCININSNDKYNWRYRRCFEIDHTDSDAEDLEEYQIYLDIDTDDLVTDGKMQSDGDDIRFVDSDNNLLDYYIADDMNEDSTRIWLQMDNIDAGKTEDICMYYGNSSASGVSSREDVFTYSQKEKIYYVVADSAEDSHTSFISYVDDNDIVIGAYDDTLDEFEDATQPDGTANYTQTTEFSVLGPIMGAFADNGTPPLVPKSAAGTDFVYRMDRYTNEFSIVSPWCDASIAMENSAGNTLAGSPFSISAGNAIDVTTNDSSANGLPNNDVVIIEEAGGDCPVLITHHSTATTPQDSFVLYPTATEWYGVGSGSFEIAAIEDSTSITVYRSTGTSSTYSLNRGDEISVNDSGSDGSDPAHRIVADKPVGVKSIADSDGTEATTFLPVDELDYKYYIPQDVQYMAIATYEGKTTTVDLWEDGTNCGVGTADETSTVTPSSNNPGKVFFGDTAEGLEYSAGACLVADNPIFVYYEYEDTDDETNTWGMKQNRQYIYPEPTVSVGSTDTSTTWDLGESSPHVWNRRRSITFTNNSNTDLTDYQVAINLDSYSDIFSNSQSNGGDLRVAGSDGDGNDDVDYWLENYDSAGTKGKLWVQFPSVSANSSETLYLYYAHTPTSSAVTTTGSEVEVFTNESLESIFYIVDSNSDDSNLDVISFVDNNEVNDGYIVVDLDEGEMETMPVSGATDIKQYKAYEVTGPLHIDFDANTTDAAVPISYAGKEFVYNVGRSSDVFSFYAPFEDASIQIQQSSSSGWTTLQTVSLTKGDAVTVPRDITNNRAFKIVSDEDILAFHRNGSSDSKILYPTRLGLEEDSGDYELYGIGSGFVRLASSSDASVTVYRSNGTSTSVTLNSSNNFVWNESGSGDQGTAYGYHIVSDAPIGASGYADADGGEAVIFVSQKEFSDTYALSDDAQYFAMVAKDASVTCRVYDDSGTEVTTDSTGNMDHIPPQTGGTRTLPYVNNIHIGGDDTSDGAFFNAGYSMVCDEPVYAYYEHQITGVTDETSWLTWPQARKYATVEPDVDDPDDSDEEGLYYESGFDSAGSGSDPEAYMEFMLDTSSLTYGRHVVWDSIDWEEIINSRSAQNSVKQIEYKIAYADASPSCASATYSSWETIYPMVTSSTEDTSIDYVTYYKNEKKAKIPDNFSDHPCLKVRAYVRTGDEAYSPKINKINTNYYVPTLLEDQLSSPTIDVVGATSGNDERYRVLKAITIDTGLTGSQVFTTYVDSSDNTVFNQADIDLLEISTQTINGQFAFPPFPTTTPVDASTNSPFDNSHDVAVYFTHERSSGSTETMDFIFNVDIMSAGGPRISRDFQLNISGL